MMCPKALPGSIRNGSWGNLCTMPWDFRLAPGVPSLPAAVCWAKLSAGQAAAATAPAGGRAASPPPRQIPGRTSAAAPTSCHSVWSPAEDDGVSSQNRPSAAAEAFCHQCKCVLCIYDMQICNPLQATCGKPCCHMSDTIGLAFRSVSILRMRSWARCSRAASRRAFQLARYMTLECTAHAAGLSRKPNRQSAMVRP